MSISPTPLDPPSLQDLMTRSFFAMRWGLFVIGVGLPPVLWFWAWVAHPHHALPDSISGYYHTAARNLFVGALVAVGLLLFLYKAFNTAENLLLNISGIATIGVAFFPCNPDPGATDNSAMGFWVHGVFALITFLTQGIVAVFFASTTIKLLGEERLRRRFRMTYRILGLLMIVLPLVALLTTTTLKESHSTFWIELAGVYAFAAYWATKTIEYRKTSAERNAVRGTLDLNAVR